MTDSDSLRGDNPPDHALHELNTLRALLRPRMAEAGDPTPTEALRGMFIEIERLRVTTSEGARCQALEESLATAGADLTVAKHALQTLRGRLHELLQLSMDGTSDRDIFERIESLKAKLAEERKRTNILAEEATAESRLARAAADGHDHARAPLVAIAEVFGRVDDLDSLPAKVRELDDAMRASLAKVDRLQDRVDEQDKDRVIRVSETAAERKRLETELKHAVAKNTQWSSGSEQLQGRLNELTAELVALTTAIGNAAKEVGVLCEGRSALDILPDLLAYMKRRAQREVVESVQWCTVNAGRGLAAELAQDAARKLQVALASSTDLTVRWAIAHALHIGAETAVAWADSYWRPKLSEATRAAADLPQTLPASLTTLRESSCPKLDEVCHVRPGRPRFMTGDAQLQVWVIEPAALPGYEISGRDDRWQWNNDTHATCIAGYTSAAEAIAGARENSKATQSRVGLERWTKICEAFGFDPEQDPPVSIPAILAGDRWTNTRRMLADACANMRAPSLEVILGELVQTLSKARGANKHVDQHTCTACTRRIHEGEKAVQGCSDCYWLEFGDAPPRAQEEALATAQARAARPSTARCPVCHRMAPVRHGGFEKHMSGDRICAGTCMLLDLARARSQALNVLGWSGADDPLEWAKEARRLADERIDVLQAELGVHAAAIAEAEIQTEKLVAALNEKIAALDVADAHISSLKSGSDEAHAALATLGWDGNSYPADWAKTTAAHYKAVREAMGIPADKPIIPYAQHVAKGMQALAILGWQDTHPVEWATKRAAAEADLRGAFAEAELVGSDHAAMVRQLWGNLRSKSAQHRAVTEERNAQIDECAVLRTVITERNARIHQLEIDYSKVHLEGRIELVEKRLSTWRAWAAGFCPMGFDASASDDSIIAALAFVPAAAYDREIKALQSELAHLRSLVSVMVDIKRRLVAIKDLSP